MKEAQAAIEDVKVVLPEGMKVRDHSLLSDNKLTNDMDKGTKESELDKPEDSDKIIKQIQE